VIRALEDDRGELQLVRVPVDVADDPADHPTPPGKTCQSSTKDDRDLELCQDHDQPKKRAEAERSPEGEPEAGVSVKGATAGSAENGTRKPAQRARASEQDRGRGRRRGRGGGGCTVSCTCVKVTPRVPSVGVSRTERSKLGVAG
jgi:hypothetical protein